MGPAFTAKPRSPGTVRVRGERQGVVSLPVLLWTAAWGSHWGGARGPSCGQWEDRQGGSHWFGQMTSSRWNHSPVSVFHCLTTLTASRPGVRG